MYVINNGYFVILKYEFISAARYEPSNPPAIKKDSHILIKIKICVFGNQNFQRQLANGVVSNARDS